MTILIQCHITDTEINIRMTSHQNYASHDNFYVNTVNYNLIVSVHVHEIAQIIQSFS